MGEVQLNFLLLGRTGHGKSATGNTLLNRRVFKTSANTTSETKNVDSSYSQFQNYELLVVDGPGLEDTAMIQGEDKIMAAKHMDIALAMCNGGVDAFLYVLKFGSRFTEEEKMALDALKQFLGNDFMKYVIVVVTCGDLFHYAMEEEEKCHVSFHDWCREKGGAFQELYENCEGRFVLFNNRDRDKRRKRAQIQGIINLVEDLQTRFSRYTSQCFENARIEKEKLILEMRAPQLKETIQKRICLLTAEIEDLSTRPSDDVKDKIRERVQQLKNEINKEGKGYDSLTELRHIVVNVEENLNDVEKLIILAKDFEEIRQSKQTWNVLGTVCAVASGVVTIATPLVGLSLAACNALFAGLSYLVLSSDESKIEKELNSVKKKRKLSRTSDLEELERLT